MSIKYADELKKLSRRNPLVLYYEHLLEDLRVEASYGGNHKVIAVGKDKYNDICKKLMNGGFTVFINNYNEDNESFMVFIVWDKEKFDKALEEATDMDKTTFHYGLI